MNRPNKTPRFFIGIDAGHRTGLATWNAAEERFDRLETTTLWEAIALVETYLAGEIVVVEDPAQNRATFAHGTPRTLQAARRREKISRDVGQNQREAKLLADGLGRKGYRVRRTRPRSRKLDAEQFRRLTKHQGRTSQHARDAGMLVFGLKRVPVELDELPGALSLKLYAPPA